MSDLPASTGKDGTTRHFLTFRLADRRYALPAEDIAEIIRIPAVARVPQSPKGLMGVANLRGSVIPVASTRSLLGQAEAAPGQGRAIVMDGSAPVALAVDAVEELLQVASAGVETRQAELAALPEERLQGAFRPSVDADFVKILDIRTLLSSAFVARERSQGAVRRNGAAAQTVQGGAAVQTPQTRLVAFEVNGQDYALPLDCVQEIIAAPAALAQVPHADAIVLGVASLRETLLPLLSLRALLGFAAAPQAASREKVVVTMVGGALVGLVVDRMRALFAADEARMDPVPDVLAARTGGESRISAIYRGDSGLISILAPEQLFGDDVMRKLGSQPLHQLAVTGPQEGKSLQFLVFRLGDEEFGLPIEAVEEVARVPDQIARVPKTPKFLEGVINLRGEVLPVVDQRRRFHMPKLEDSAGRRLVVVRTAALRAGLIVDSVSEVVRSSAEAIEPAPDLTGETSRLVQGILNLQGAGRMVLLLDPSELLSRAEQGLLEAFDMAQAPERPGK